MPCTTAGLSGRTVADRCRNDSGVNSVIHVSMAGSVGSQATRQKAGDEDSAHSTNIVVAAAKTACGVWSPAVHPGVVTDGAGVHPAMDRTATVIRRSTDW
ncbi:hypothetical protein GCM10025792_14140 [Pseudonocardia tropica]